MKLNSSHEEIAERLGAGVFFHTQRNQFLLLERRATAWELVLLDTGWENTTQYNLLALDEKYLVKLPPDSRDIESMIELWQAKQEGQSKLGRCTPHSCCPSHAMQMELDLEEESPLEELFDSLVGARQACPDEKVILGYVAHENDPLGAYKVMIEYIGEQPEDEDDE